ncbi:MAG: hypothetical protein F4X17_02175 [Gemmatimonadetes bacterium]|nr:hypothetical protein [Gemmatimonadota bacterium]
MKRTIIIFLALLFSLSPAAAQDEGVFERRPTDFLPLQVGNQWTYKQRYWNFAYGWRKELAPETRALFELPGYPYDNPGNPPDSLLWVERELTIEITHTEMIDGLEYFVFSQADYDWPPLPTLFWAGQKVRLSDEGVLLFRWNGQDVPLYDFNPQHPSSYSIPAYPLREDLVTKLDVWRWHMIGQRQIEFSVYPELNLPNNMQSVSGISIWVIPGYGLGCNESYYTGGDFDMGFKEIHLFYLNDLESISAIISGEVVSYKQAGRRDVNTHVQSSSWGQLKRAFRPR